ncbi:DUF4142 domain-containing protein [Rhizobium sp. CFBP 8762]|uniref:DUF4142 domain-containing protein n=1 Tax=Rhizobium sp. CFBP 8762 TaxID=2775279 RepID=UPI00177C195A|nr:DUF4142 domain-containing protein [Rhizobium sp. CFBP 8762]MBD8556676.1 DUF4142 domain-containing protein [Rhizobium sp. CFBP 8762]
MYKVIAPALLAAALMSGAVQAKDAKPADSAKAMMKVDTADFAKTVMSSNAFEIKSSELAKQKSSLDDVKMFADQMIKDHTKADADLKTALSASKMDAPAPMLAPKHDAMIKQLEAVDGADFDALYIDMQAQAHMEAVALFRTYIASGDDKQVVAFAKKTLPSLEIHMKHVTELVAKH